MSSYRLDAMPETTVQVFNQEIDPVLTVDPGDTVLLRSLDASGSLDRQKTPGEDVPTMFSERRGHCLTGPIAVRGASRAITWRCGSSRSGLTTGAGRSPPTGTAHNQASWPARGRPAVWLLWQIDADAGRATASTATPCGPRRSTA